MGGYYNRFTFSIKTDNFQKKLQSKKMKTQTTFEVQTPKISGGAKISTVFYFVVQCTSFRHKVVPCANTLILVHAKTLSRSSESRVTYKNVI